jgi:diaminohydroxyphosphoribosylaminopyrimidine deaminase/5-amino-6-(5-phosphoribosylamino)uracil reductase
MSKDHKSMADFNAVFHEKMMRRALSLAEKGRGFVSPNPLVGCVIVDAEGDIIGEGYHERFGQPHAEINALNTVKDKNLLAGATVYVTLEPCAHHGKTPPCVDTLIRYPLKRVVAAMQDPNPRVSGSGFEILRKHGIEVLTGVCEAEAREQNRFFLHFIRTGMPYVTLKIAQTLDGYIATPGGQNEVITGKEAQKRVHTWRSQYDAVLIGRNTALLDNPKLTVRLVEGRQPWRVVIDGDASLPDSLHLFTDAFDAKTIRVTYNKARASAEDPMLALLSGKSVGYSWLTVGQKNGHVDLEEALLQLGRRGIASILVEGGQHLSTALLKNDLVNRLEVFIAPKILGGGIKSILGLEISEISRAIPLHRVTTEMVGQDVLFSADL